MIGRRPAFIVALWIAATAGPRLAAAEDGLFIARMSGGVSTVHPDTPALGHMWNGSMDLMVTERTGIIASCHLVVHDNARTLGLGLGVKRLLVERFWKRLYMQLSPELLLIWRDGEHRRLDAAIRAEIGYEQLLMWGFGYVVELHGTATAGRGEADQLDASSAGLTLGFFMEF